MCGICGMVQNHIPVDETVLHAMTDAMIHRGPNDVGYFVDGNIGLGFRRLSIVDIQNGHQPMANEDGSVWVVFNGEIYNHVRLRKDLEQRGHRFQSEADTEVIVHLYEEFGIDCLSSLSGMFAFAILDLRARTLYVARDHFGIKPLYYASSPDGLLFASELRSILNSQAVARNLNMQAVWDYFTFQYVPSPLTMVQGVHKLPAAHYLRYKDGDLTLRRYWSPAYIPDSSKPFDYFVEGVRAELAASVQRHLQGSVPLGSFLSSGVDSSAIAALVSKHQALTTFSIGFQDASNSMNELSEAESLAKRLGSTHHSLAVTRADFMERLPQALHSLEEPLGDPSAIALYFIAELASRHVTVVLSGEGADEVFGGYPIYHEPVSLAMFEYLPRSLRSGLGRLAHMLPHGQKGRDFLIRGSHSIERRFMGNIRVFTEEAKRDLFCADTFSDLPLPSFHVTDPIYQDTVGLDDITRMQLVDLTTWLPGDILFKADKMTMAHSLELRVPYLDRKLFEFAATIPVKYRVQGQQGKVTLRAAVRDLLPPEVTNRPKLGFPVPYREWLREESGLVWDVFHSSSARYLFQGEQIERMLREHRGRERDHGRALWTLFAFLLWHQVIME